MPLEFDNCVANKGRVRTIKIGATKYMHVCYLKGKSFQGEVHTKKTKKKK